MRKKHKRWLAKSLTWRISGIVILGFFVWIFTKEWEIITGLTLGFHAFRFVLYYGHEWLWDKVNWWR
jgi:hypothetical protein